MAMETIFVSIASYKDSELQFTVDTLLTRAIHPDRLNIVIAQQDYPERFITFNHSNVHCLNYDYVESQGVCWARNLIQNHYNNEDYFLQIDSHIAMVVGWDEIIIEQIKLVTERSPKCVFASYPTNYQIVNGERAFYPPYVPRTVLRTDNVFEFLNASGGDNRFDTPIPSPYLNAGCMFGTGTFMAECRYDPVIYFEGEELLNTLKAYTYGYDLYNPCKHICWHLYKMWDEPDRSKWSLHHNEQDDIKRPKRFFEREKESKQKLYEIFRGQRPEELGTVRSIEDYENYIRRKILK